MSQPSGIRSRLVSSVLSDAVLLGGVTLLGYLGAYLFVMGEADALGIPEQFVTVSLETTLFVTFVLFGILFAAAIFGGFAMNLIMSDTAVHFRTNALFHFYELIAGVTLLILAAAVVISPIMYAMLFVPVLLVCELMARPIIENRSIRNYFAHLETLAKTRRQLNKPKPDWVTQRLGNFPIWTLIALAIWILSNYFLGSADARYEKYHYASLSTPADVLLGKFGDVLVFRKMNSRVISIKVIGRDEIPPLVKVWTGSMAVAREP